MGVDVVTAPARERIVDAAFALFDEHGYDGTTVDAIAASAGVSRSTFFRLFAAKDDVIFPDHDALQARIEARLDAADSGTRFVAVVEAARMVLEHYLAEGEHARSRYRLTRSVPALRDREVAGMRSYQRLFREHVLRWEPESPGGRDRHDGRAELRAELMAAAVVTAHNVVLRRWLRKLTDEPRAEFDAAIAEVVDLFAPRPDAEETSVIVLRSSRSVETLMPQIRRALESGS